MENSVYVSISRQIALLNDIEVTANNIANINTGGYKRGTLVFKEYIDNQYNNSLSFSQDVLISQDHGQGSMQKTGNVFDLAITTPKHYFAVNTPYGLKYTKNGNFHIDDDNRLVTSEGFMVLTADGEEVVLPSKYKDIVVTDSGEVIIDSKSSSNIGIFHLHDDSMVKREGYSLLHYGGQAEIPTDDFKVVQGFLESSNVAPVVEMAKMLNISRSMEEISNLLSNINRMNHQVVNVLMELKD